MKKAMLWFAIGIVGSVFAQTKHQERWIFFNRENSKAFILVDVGLDTITPIAEHHNLFRVFLFLESVTDENPTISDEEQGQVLTIENDLIKNLAKNQAYVGRISMNGLIVFCFYSKDQSIENVVSSVMRKHPGKSYKTEFKVDPEWTSYFEFMLPTAAETRIYWNNLMANNFGEIDDDQDNKKEIAHWIYFSTNKGRNLFLKEVEKNGYVYVGKENKKDDLPYKLQIKAGSTIETQNAKQSILYLLEMAPRYYGEYNGWEEYLKK